MVRTYFKVTCCGHEVFAGMVTDGGPVKMLVKPKEKASGETVRAIESAALELHNNGRLASVTVCDGLYAVERKARL